MDLLEIQVTPSRDELRVACPLLIDIYEQLGNV